MKRMSLAINNLRSLKTSVASKVNALSSANYTASEKTAIKNWYNSEIDNLISDIQDLKTPMYFGYNHTVTALIEVIMIAIQYLTFHPGYEYSLWDAIDPDGTLNTVKNLTINEVWIGATQSGQHSLLSQYQSSLQNARRNMNANLENVRSQFAGLHSGSILEPFLEARQPEMPEGRTELPSIQESATTLYNNWDLKDIISEMNFDIYIPTYVR
jgi:hypothetical protein